MRDLAMVEKEENVYQSLINPLRSVIDLNCSTFYRKINDTLIEGMIDTFDEAYIYELFEKICSYYQIMEHKHDKLLLKEIIYRLMIFNNNIIYTPQKLYTINSSQDFRDLYVIIQMIYRPIRHYESTEVFLSFINKVSHTYKVVIYSYLVVNSVFEILLFVLLKKYFLADFIFINQSLQIIERFFNNI